MPGEPTLNYPIRPGSPRFDNQVVSIITLGTLAMCLGLYAIDRIVDFMDYSPVTITVFIYCLSGLLLVHAVHAIRSRMLTEAVMMIITAFTAMLYASYILAGNSILMYSILLFAVGLAICGILFYARDQKFMALICGILALLLAIKTIFPHGGSLIASVLLLIGGALLLTVGGLALAGHPWGDVIRCDSVQEISDEEFPRVFVATVGLLVFVAMTFSVGIADFDGTGKDWVFIFFKFLISALCTLIGAYAIYHEIVFDGCLYLIVGISSMMSSITLIISGSAVNHLDIILGVILLALSVAMIQDKEYYDGITSIKYGFILILGFFATDSAVLTLLITITKFSVTAFALYTLFTTPSKNMNIIDAVTKITGESKWLHRKTKE